MSDEGDHGASLFLTEAPPSESSRKEFLTFKTERSSIESRRSTITKQAE